MIDTIHNACVLEIRWMKIKIPYYCKHKITGINLETIFGFSVFLRH